MGDPKLTRSSVTIRYAADDGYRSEQHIKTAEGAPTEAALLEGLEELARLTALFGFQEEAMQRFVDARNRVFEWRKAKETTQ